MNGYLIQMILFSVVYISLIFFAVRIFKRLSFRRNKGDDDDGGIEVYRDPDLDLPPGVSLPDGPKVKIKKDVEEPAF